MPESTINIVSSDEKTGIQALCHAHTQEAKPKRVERKVPEYIRNGTSSLIAALDVKTGQIQNYSLGGARKEEGYLEHVKKTVPLTPLGNTL